MTKPAVEKSFFEITPADLRAQFIFFGILGLVCATFGTVLNLILLSFHLKKERKGLSGTLYICINFVDFLISTTLFLVVASSLNMGEPTFFSSPLVCEVWYCVWHLVQRLSIYLIGILCILRTRSLMYPLKPQFKWRIIVGIIIFFVLAITMFGSIPVAVYKIPVPYSFRIQRPNFMEDVFFKKLDGLTKARVYMIFRVLFGFFPPYLPIVILCCISGVILRRQAQRVQVTQSTNHKASVTILILTLLYIILNGPLAVLDFNSILESLSDIFGKPLSMFDQQTLFDTDPEGYIFFTCFLYTHSVSLNSTLNAVVYICRTRQILLYIKTGFKQNVDRFTSLFEKDGDTLDNNFVLTNMSIVSVPRD